MDRNFYILLISALLFLLCFSIILYKKKKKYLSPTVTLDQKNSFLAKFKDLFSSTSLENDILEKIEETLIEADVSLEVTGIILRAIKKENKFSKEILKKVIVSILEKDYQNTDILMDTSQKLNVLLFVGVNGVGKTTTIGKLAHKLKKQNNSVMLVPADTFRAGAIDQLKHWAKISKSEFSVSKEGDDPASVVYKSIEKALAHKIDVLLIDTAGRVHNNTNLMRQLEKIDRVIKKLLPDEASQRIIVIDGTAGQNALLQLQEFQKICKLSGVAMTKLDGSAKGGMVLGIKHNFNLPIKLIGKGEKITDLEAFDIKKYVNDLLE